MLGRGNIWDCEGLFGQLKCILWINGFYVFLLLETPSANSESQSLTHEEEEKKRRNTDMGILLDDVVLIRPSEKHDEPSVITVNCPDKTGLGCDLCRVILFFGLNIVRGGE